MFFYINVERPSRKKVRPSENGGGKTSGYA
nr:MAG TPA: hypothetical protein [Caudoviricetes sp.]